MKAYVQRELAMRESDCRITSIPPDGEGNSDQHARLNWSSSRHANKETDEMALRVDPR